MRIKDQKDAILLLSKWISIPLVFIVIYYQLFVLEDFTDAVSNFKTGLTSKSWLFLAIVVLLMPLNLGTEAKKWQLLLKASHKLTYMESLQSVFAGISFSIFTPKRIGEYAGRLLLVNKNRTSAAGSLFVGNFAQMITNLIIGFISAVLFLSKFSVGIEKLNWLLPVSFLLTLLLIICYFNSTFILGYFRRNPFIERHWEKIQILSSYQNQTLFSFLTLSTLKYIVFVIQFVLLLYVFGAEINFFWALITAACVFFVKTLLPLPSSVELMARGGIAIYFFSFLTDNHIGILVASILLWVINLALPAMIGSYFISKTRL